MKRTLEKLFFLRLDHVTGLTFTQVQENQTKRSDFLRLTTHKVLFGSVYIVVFFKSVTMDKKTNPSDGSLLPKKT